jgi:hypothetical protein
LKNELNSFGDCRCSSVPACFPVIERVIKTGRGKAAGGVAPGLDSMKREGRIHGTNVRLGKRAWGYGGHGAKIIASKPTNKSKGAMKYQPVAPAVTHIVYNEHELPLQKSIGKTKSAFKAKNMDVTRNHMMQDWSLHDRGLAIEENYDYDHDGGSDYYEDAYQEEAGEQWPSDDYVSGEEDEVDEGDQQPQEEEPKSRRYRDRSEIVLPIESLLTNRKRKVAPKANALYLLEAKAVHQEQQQQQVQQQQQPQQLPEAVVDVKGAEFAEIVLEGAEVNNIDELESWLGLGFYDGEEVPDDWFLITEKQEFVTAV